MSQVVVTTLKFRGISLQGRKGSQSPLPNQYRTNSAGIFECSRKKKIGCKGLYVPEIRIYVQK